MLQFSVSKFRQHGENKADFVNKLRVAEEELDETMHFYELLAEFNEPFKQELRGLYVIANELLSINIASINTDLKNMTAEKEKATGQIRSKIKNH
ncbi:MAG: four helix bundle protein [Chitinophagaceae bacterium]|nr:four helix bundle protein [Chitinophagaceae bacterium]